MSKNIHTVITARGNGKKTYERDGDVIKIEISDRDYEYLKATTEKYDIETINKQGSILNSGLQNAGVDTDTYYTGALFKSEVI
ncbi:MAG TPA: hypothetical protein VE130_10550 [Nitrososphaeraceae archaeon]|jgi:hypothetical protein|nr:hypothetical protein [Nitrososphaeraceae archaeon]